MGFSPAGIVVKSLLGQLGTVVSLVSVRLTNPAAQDISRTPTEHLPLGRNQLMALESTSWKPLSPQLWKVMSGPNTSRRARRMNISQHLKSGNNGAGPPLEQLNRRNIVLRYPQNEATAWLEWPVSDWLLLAKCSGYLLQLRFRYGIIFKSATFHEPIL